VTALPAIADRDRPARTANGVTRGAEESSCGLFLCRACRARATVGRRVEVAVAFDPDELGVAEQSIHGCAREQRVAEEARELIDVTVRRDDGRAALGAVDVS
jgi:hypothetical protein